MYIYIYIYIYTIYIHYNIYMTTFCITTLKSFITTVLEVVLLFDNY